MNAKDKRRAREQARLAIRNGQLSRPDVCDDCGNDEEIFAHHTDYSQPLLIDWLCRPCHGGRHRDDPRGPGRPVHTTAPDSLYVGLREVEQMLGVSRQRVDQLARQVGFPKPVAELKAGRIWRRQDVQQWIDGRKKAK